MEIVDRTLPAHCRSGRPLKTVKAIVIHYISGEFLAAPERMFELDDVVKMLEQLNLPGDKKTDLFLKDQRFAANGTPLPRMYASYHYLIGRDGQVVRVTPENLQAYHAGESSFRGEPNCNAFTIGVSCVATHKSGYTDAQYEALSTLCAELMLKYGLTVEELTGHEHVAPGRKRDPGPMFDWNRLRADAHKKME